MAVVNFENLKTICANDYELQTIMNYWTVTSKQSYLIKLLDIYVKQHINVQSHFTEDDWLWYVRYLACVYAVFFKLMDYSESCILGDKASKAAMVVPGPTLVSDSELNDFSIYKLAHVSMFSGGLLLKYDHGKFTDENPECYASPLNFFVAPLDEIDWDNYYRVKRMDYIWETPIRISLGEKSKQSLKQIKAWSSNPHLNFVAEVILKQANFSKIANVIEDNILAKK